MIQGSRVVIFLLLGILILVGLGMFLLLDAVQGRGGPACLDAVAPAPFAGFWQVAGTPSEDEPWAIEYDDELRIQIDRNPRRIASALPGITEMVAYLGRGPELVAVTPYCDHPADVVSGLPKISVLPFDPEGVLTVSPDLLVVDRRMHRRDLDVIRERVPNTLLLDTSSSLGHLAQSFTLLHTVIGADKDGTQRLQGWQARYETLLADLKRRKPQTPPRVLAVVQWDPLYVLGRGSLIDDLLRACGCVNIACDLESDASGVFAEELVLVRRPDWILTPKELMPDRLRKRWANVPAVKQGHFFDASGDDLVRAGPRILDGLERLADALLGADAK